MASKFHLCSNISYTDVSASTEQKARTFTMQKYIPSMSLYAPFYLRQRQLCVFLCASINHSKHRLCLICVLYQLRRRSYHSPDRSLCPGYPLHIPSSHPRSPPLILLPGQEAPEPTLGKPLREEAGWRNEERGKHKRRVRRPLVSR